MNAETLKPCPFCGGEAEYERKGDNRQSTIVSCTMCGCVLESGIEWDHWRDWNTRAADNIALQAEVERLLEALKRIDDADPHNISAAGRIARAALNETQETTDNS